MDVAKYLPKLPILKWLPKYNAGTFRDDFIAGITVGLMVVPQSLAYAANIAGLPAESGLYSSWAGIMIYMFLGTAKDITLGPTAIMSKITAENAGTEHFCTKNSKGVFEDPTKCEIVTNKAVLLCLFGGLINLVMGLLHLGFVIDFISYPVLTGFTTSAALTIAWGQVHSLVGLSSKIVRRPFALAVHDVFAHLDKAKYPDVIMSVVCILMTIALQKLKRKMESIKNRNVAQNALWFMGAAGNFFVVLFGIIVVKICSSVSDDIVCSKHLTKGCLTDEGHIPAGLHIKAPPAVTGSEVGSLATGAVLVALIGYLESVAIASAFARSNGYEIDTTQELVAIGCSNIVSYFVRAFPVTGSFSRTAVNSATGVATPAAGLITGGLVLLAIQFLTPVMAYISKASLGSIIIVSVLKMFNYNLPLELWRVSKIDLIPWAISFFGCTFLGIEYGVGFGALANMLVLVFYTARPDHKVFWQDQKKALPMSAVTGDSEPLSVSNSGKIAVCSIGGPILYPVGKTWKKVLADAVGSKHCRSVVLDFTRVTRIDYTGVQALREAVEDCRAVDVSVHLAEVSPLVNEILSRSGFWAKMQLSEGAAAQTVSSAVAAAELDDSKVSDKNMSDDPSQPLLPKDSASKGSIQ